METTDSFPKSEKPSKKLGILPHILGLLFGFIGPLIVYVFADEDFVKKNASEALTWQVFLSLYTIVAIFGFSFILGFLLFPLLLVLNIIFSTIASAKARQGEVWSYPLTKNLFESRDTEAEEETQNGRKTEFSRLPKDEKIKKAKNMYMRGEITENELDNKLDNIIEENKEEDNREYSVEYN